MKTGLYAFYLFESCAISSTAIQWSDPFVYGAISLSLLFLCLFLVVEVFVAVEPVLPPFLLIQTVPVLVGASNALAAVCNLSVTYFLPVWFQTVMLSSASTAGITMHSPCVDEDLQIYFPFHRTAPTAKQYLHLNGVYLRWASLFYVFVSHFSCFISTLPCDTYRWMMQKTGRYKMLNMVFGIFPLGAALLLTQMREDSGWAHQWLSIVSGDFHFFNPPLKNMRPYRYNGG